MVGNEWCRLCSKSLTYSQQQKLTERAMLQSMGFDWVALLSSHDGVTLQPPATEGDLHSAEDRLAATLSPDLQDLYLATNGVFDNTGQWFVVWPLAEVVTRNQTDWHYAATDAERRNWVGFGDDGTGAPFCMARDGVGGVVKWSPIEGEVIWLADTVMDFWERWCAGTLPRF